MRKKSLITFLFIIFSVSLIMVFTMIKCFADNPIVQTNYTADPAPMVHNGTFYVYSGHDEDNSTVWFNMKEWRCYSTTDMSNWTDLGSPMNLNTFSWAASDAWAGQCVARNGKFYYYVPVRPKTGGWAIGVGVSNNPEGPFTDALGHPLVSNNDYYIDPTAYVDDDGQAYMYWGNPYLYMVKLNQDMISTSGSVTQMTRNATTFNNMYGEAPWFYKRNGLYYMLFAANGSNEDIRYSTSSSPTGPWSYRGVIMPVQGIDGKVAWTNHPGVADYKGNSYFVYHNSAIGGAFMRSVAVEQFKYNADGTFPTINMTKEGPPQIGNLNPFVKNEAETICWGSGVKTEKCSEGGMDVCNIENGDWIKVKGVDFGSNTTSFDARVASANNGGNIEIRLDSSTGKLVGTCAVSNTGGLQTWVTKSCTISGATGVHDLYLKFTGGSGSLFNFNWWKFYESGTSIPTPTQITPTPTGTSDETPVITPTASITPTTTPGSSYVRFRNSATGLYIDGMESTSNGSDACQWSDSASDNQQWTIIASGDYVMIKNRATGLYLDGMGKTSNGSVCGQWSNSGSDNQQWIQETMGNYVRFKNRATGLYLDGMGSTSNGSSLCQWGNSGSANQQWQIQ